MSSLPFTSSFASDNFTLYKTWLHDRSVIYRFTTWTNVTSWLGNTLGFNVKTSVIFLKVQDTYMAAAYDALKREGIVLDPTVRENGLNDSLGTMAVQKAKLIFGTTSGKDILAMCKKHVTTGKVSVEVREEGYIRLYTIVFSPNGTKLRGRDMKDFVDKNFAMQIGHGRNHPEKALIVAIRNIMTLENAGEALLGDGEDSGQQNSGYPGGSMTRYH